MATIASSGGRGKEKVETDISSLGILFEFYNPFRVLFLNKFHKRSKDSKFYLWISSPAREAATTHFRPSLKLWRRDVANGAAEAN